MVYVRIYHGLKYVLLLYVLVFNPEDVSVSAEELLYDGNVTVIGLFEIFEPGNGGCGTRVVRESVMAAEAVKWFFERLNEAGALQLRIGLHGYPTCRDDTLAAQVAIDVVSQTYTFDNQTIIGVIGPGFSSEAEAASAIFSSVKEDSRLLTIGYSTTAETLSRSKYPNFFRVVPNDRLQVQVMVESMVIMEWNRIAVIYENDTYGQHAMGSLKILSESNNICVAYTAAINTVSGINSAEIETISNALMFGGRPPIGGFVFFGSASTANILLQKMNSLGVKDVPIGMFSDGINMNLNTFRTLNNYIEKTRGSLIMSPTYRIIGEFGSHWKAIFTNESVFDKERATNPWLRDVYADIKECDPESPCQFSPLTDSEYDTTFPQQPLYIQYALMAAHAVAKTLETLYLSYCPDRSAPSCDFFNNFRQGHMIETMKNVRLNFANDFPTSLESMLGVEMGFDENSGPNTSETTTSYQLYNLRRTGLDEGEVAFVKVGDFINGRTVLDPNDIVDYQDGAARTWPEVRKGQCGTGQICEECIPTDLPYMYVHEPGDLYVIGLVPIYDKAGTQDCGGIRPYHGYQLVEAIRFAVRKFNEADGVYSQYFQGARVGVVVINTCNNPAVVERKILRLHKEGLRLSNGSVVDMEKRILGYAGPLASEIAIAVSRVLYNLRKVSIAYAATSPVLSDRSMYTYFMRVVSSVEEQVNAMVHILEELEANYVQVLYSEGAYGEGGISALRAVLKLKRICIIQDIMVPEADSYYEYYDILRRYPHAKIVIVFLRSHVIGPFMQTLAGQMTRGEFVFIGSQAWALNRDILENDPDNKLLGSFSIVLELAQDSELLSHIQQSIAPQHYTVNPWSLEYLQAKWQCHYRTSFDKRFQSKCEESYSSKISLDSSSTAAYYSALSMLIGSGSFLRSVCGSGVTLLCDDYLRNPEGLVKATQDNVKLDIYGQGVKQRMFNENGDGNVGYAIYNIQRAADQPQMLRYFKVGQYPLLGSFTFNKQLLVYPTGLEFKSRCPNAQACAVCDFGDSGVVSDTPSDRSILSKSEIALLVLFILSFTAAVILAILFYRLKRQTHTDQPIYLTPHVPGEDGSGSTYHEMPNRPTSCPRPPPVEEETEPCQEIRVPSAVDLNQSTVKRPDFTI